VFSEQAGQIERDRDVGLPSPSHREDLAGDVLVLDRRCLFAAKIILGTDLGIFGGAGHKD